MPDLVSTPEMSTEMEAGAAPWASAARGWKGTRKALVLKPMYSSAKATLVALLTRPGISAAS